MISLRVSQMTSIWNNDGVFKLTLLYVRSVGRIVRPKPMFVQSVTTTIVLVAVLCGLCLVLVCLCLAACYFSYVCLSALVLFVCCFHVFFDLRALMIP